MALKTINRYIWLLNTLMQKRYQTLEEISNRWAQSSLGDGRPLSRRTFFQHVQEIREVFGVEIKCTTPNGYKYFIQDLENLKRDRTLYWLFSSLSVSNTIQAGHNMNGRIIFEEIPRGNEYIQPVVDAMQHSNVLLIEYQPFGKNRLSLHLEPYAMKVYQHRWYVLGRLQESGSIRHISLDRLNELEVLDDTFVLPKHFDAGKYYADSVGIYVNETLKPRDVRIRVYGSMVDYVRTVKLHRTQEEVLTKHGEYSEFHCKVCLTPDLYTQILAMGPSVEVLEPMELRKAILDRLFETVRLYKTAENA